MNLVKYFSIISLLFIIFSCKKENKVTVAVIESLQCDSIIQIGKLRRGIESDGINVILPYEGGNGGFYDSLNINSTGVLGLNASLSAGQLKEGKDVLIFKLSGIPQTTGQAIFSFSLGGQTCNLSLKVNSLLLTSGNPLSIGADYQGGKIGYIYQNGDNGYVPGEFHGIIVTPTDYGSWSWGCNLTGIVAFGTTLGYGKVNTEKIVQACPQEGAARVAYNVVLNGYDDWWLPSIDELMLLYRSRLIIGGFNEGGAYWSSTAYIFKDQAYFYSFLGGRVGYVSKSFMFGIRPIRYF